VAAIAGIGSGGHSRLGRTSILAAGGWSDCCPEYSSAEIRMALNCAIAFLFVVFVMSVFATGKFRRTQPTSAFGGKADISRTFPNVCF